MHAVYSYNNFQCVDILMSWLYNIACWELAGCSVYIAKSYCCFLEPKDIELYFICSSSSAQLRPCSEQIDIN